MVLKTSSNQPCGRDSEYITGAFLKSFSIYIYIYITGGDLFTKKGSGRMESPLLRHPEGTGPSLFSAELKS